MIGMLTPVGNEVPTRAGTGSGNELPALGRSGDHGPHAQPREAAVAGPRHRVSPPVLTLLETARRGLAEAGAESDPGTR